MPGQGVKDQCDAKRSCATRSVAVVALVARRLPLGPRLDPKLQDRVWMAKVFVSMMQPEVTTRALWTATHSPSTVDWTS